MNLKLRALLMQLAAITAADIGTAARDELRELSDALFAVNGDVEIELGDRCGEQLPREEFAVN